MWLKNGRNALVAGGCHFFFSIVNFEFLCLYVKIRSILDFF